MRHCQISVDGSGRHAVLQSVADFELTIYNVAGSSEQCEGAVGLSGSIIDSGVAFQGFQHV